MFCIEKILFEVSGISALRGTLESEQVTRVINGSCFNLKLSKYSRLWEDVNTVFPSTIREMISGMVIVVLFKIPIHVKIWNCGNYAIFYEEVTE